jgi:hypothetical protein
VLGELLTSVGSGLWETVLASAPLLVTGAVVKHGGRLFSRVPNNAIPYLNWGLGTAVGTAVTGNFEQGLQFGTVAAGSAAGMHQVLKIGFEKLIGRNLSKSAQADIGPGSKASI